MGAPYTPFAGDGKIRAAAILKLAKAAAVTAADIEDKSALGNRVRDPDPPFPAHARTGDEKARRRLRRGRPGAFEHTPRIALTG